MRENSEQGCHVINSNIEPLAVPHPGQKPTLK